MFERNMALRIFTLFMFGMLGTQLVVTGFFLFSVLSKYGAYNNAIDSFNFILLYLLLFDFVIKYFLKQSQSMQIVPYLTLPVQRKTLLNFLLMKEFTNIWNLYFLFLLIPFVFKAIPEHHGYLSALLYILFFYLLCIGNSLLVNISNILLKRSGWYLFLPIIIVAAIVGITFIPGVDIEVGIVHACEFILEKNIVAWMTILLVAGALWKLNLSMMNADIYRAMQGKNISKSGASFRIPFLYRLGMIGTIINLELKMILRSKRLKTQPYSCVFIIIYYFFQAQLPHFKALYPNMLFFTIFTLGWLGVVMSQFIFSSESSYFDGLMSRKFSLLDMLKGKYVFYTSYSVCMLFIMAILVFTDKIDFLFLISAFFYTIGFVFFLMFQNAVYNNTYIGLSESGMFNWKGTTGNMFVVTMIGMIIPLATVMLIKVVFNETVANYFMLVTGIIFTFTANYWLKWIYSRFLKRKYRNMEGFRINT